MGLKSSAFSFIHLYFHYLPFFACLMFCYVPAENSSENAYNVRELSPVPAVRLNEELFTVMDLEEEFPFQEKQPQVEMARQNGILGLIVGPFYWLRKLSDELHWSFVLGVVTVYGINQGLCMGLSKVSTQYYMKDEQKLQPSEAQVYFGFIQIPWIIKPLWGLFTDAVPTAGNRRRPYFIIAGVIGAMSMIILSIQTNLYLVYALLLLIGGSLGVAVADVTIDACVTENSISHPSLAGDMQSLCGFSSSVGQLIGFAISGFLVHIIGSKGVFGLLSIPAGLVILVGMIIQ